MLEWVVLFYLVGVFVLFFFWIYGIVSFALDLKNKIVPGIRRYRRGRAAIEEKREREDRREEEERQLY
ncbi:hypothetical protein [Natronobiforma cellulositropha]|uniref:hypothetical protein n=1 Tax=Natronobiforma cellulositropha TaxID=1679076 RepID=UPI0021D5E475|nr:hypothetical protein [Natronobiforma cellulositropha]